MNWQQKIEAQIADLRCFQVVPGKDDYCVWEGRGKCLNCQKADTVQTLLDAMTDVVGWRERDWPEGFDRYTAELIAERALDKLREDE